MHETATPTSPPKIFLWMKPCMMHIILVYNKIMIIYTPSIVMKYNRVEPLYKDTSFNQDTMHGPSYIE